MDSRIGMPLLAEAVCHVVAKLFHAGDAQSLETSVLYKLSLYSIFAKSSDQFAGCDKVARSAILATQ
jgi:hypothetical protein